MGIEPTSAAWEAAILPLNHARSSLPYQTSRDFGKCASANTRYVLHDHGWEHRLLEALNKRHRESCYAVRLLCSK